MRSTFLAAFAIIDVSAAQAQYGPSAPTQQLVDFERQALAYEVQECFAGKVRATTQALTLQAKLVAATKRADEAETRLKGAKPAEPSAP